MYELFQSVSIPALLLLNSQVPNCIALNNSRSSVYNIILKFTNQATSMCTGVKFYEYKMERNLDCIPCIAVHANFFCRMLCGSKRHSLPRYGLLQTVVRHDMFSCSRLYIDLSCRGKGYTC
jgi:hypothetical protein